MMLNRYKWTEGLRGGGKKGMAERRERVKAGAEEKSREEDERNLERWRRMLI